MKKNLICTILFCALCSFSASANSNVKTTAVSPVAIMQEPEEELSVVEQLVAEQGKQLPVAVGEGMVLAVMGTEEGDVMYVFKVTDAVYQNLVKMGVEGMVKASLVDLAAKGANDPLTAAMVEEGYGVTYIYVNENTEEKFIYGVPADDFAAAVLSHEEEEGEE